MLIGTRDQVRQVMLAGSSDFAQLIGHGYGTDSQQAQLVKLDVSALRPAGYVDLSSYHCVPQSAVFIHIGTNA